MASDPFYIGQEQVKQTLNGITAVYDQWKNLLRTQDTSSNDQFQFVQKELKQSLEQVRRDLNVLNDAVEMMSANRAKFRLSDAEIEIRRKFVNDSKRKAQVVIDDMNSPDTRGKIETDARASLMKNQASLTGGNLNSKYGKLEESFRAENEEFVNQSQQTQLLMRKQQDEKLDLMIGSLQRIKENANTVSTELQKQDNLINQMEGQTDKGQEGIKGVMHNLNKLVDSQKEGTQWAIIIVLIVLLLIVVILIFYT